MAGDGAEPAFGERVLADLPVDVLRKVIDDAPVGIVLSGADGRYLYASAQAFVLMGEAPRSVAGDTKVDVFDPTVAARLTAMEQRLADHGGHVREVIQVSTGLGLRTVLFDKYRMGGDGSLVCTFVHDLTEFHRLEQALVDSQQRLLHVLDDAKIAALRITRDGTITDLWSGPIEFDFTIAPRDAVGRPITEYFGGSDELQAIFERALAGEHMVQVVEFFGRWLQIHIQPEGDPVAPEAINLVAIDVTERVAAELELGRTQGVLERLLSQSPVGMVAVQHAHPERPYYVSPNMAQLFGYTPGAYPFTVEWMIAQVHADDRDAVAGFLATITEVRGVPHAIEFRFLHGDGTYHWIRARSEPMFDDAQHQVGVVMFNTDITDEVRAEDERRRLEAQIRRTERLESLGQLAGGLAHDFNNLLVVIANYAQFVDAAVRREAERGAPFDADAAQAIADDLRQIGRAAETASELTRQLLVFGRREPMSHSTFDLGDVVREMRDMLTRTLGEAITPTFALSDDELPVSADAGQIQQVLLNLVVNARHAMPAGGRIEVTTRRGSVDGGRSGDSVLAPGPCAELTVSDTGHGMSDEVRERAFEPFFTTQAPGEGTGLGLATVYAVVAECGGDVELVSAPGVGTTVRIRLPISCSEPSLPAVAADPVDARAGEAVLVVEDQDAVLELTRRVLATHGYEVHVASCGDDALAQLDAGLGIDLLLTDVMMPGMLGNELAGHVRARRPGTKVLYMSGYADASVTDDPDSGGVLVKPFTPGQLLARVRDILDA
ncbi:MAG: PAS domain S-box protein [Acidimicrobiia bacterium]